MGKKKHEVPSKRIRLDGFLRMLSESETLDKREQAFLDWYLTNSVNRKAFTVMKNMMTAMLNGELGEQVQKAVSDGNTEEAIDALQDLIGSFGGSDEDDIPEPDPTPNPSPINGEGSHVA